MDNIFCIETCSSRNDTVEGKVWPGPRSPTVISAKTTPGRSANAVRTVCVGGGGGEELSRQADLV